MKIVVFYISILAFFLISCESSTNQVSDKDIKAIEQNMEEQVECWNQFDIPCYMKHYWHSDSLLFIGKNGVTKGWQSTLDNYLEGYQDSTAMGELSFDNILIQKLDKETVQVVGKWYLKRSGMKSDIFGHYSLIWQKKNGKWVIISDHSS